MKDVFFTMTVDGTWLLGETEKVQTQFSSLKKAEDLFGKILKYYSLMTALDRGCFFYMMNGHELHEFDGKWIGTCTALLRTQNDFHYKPHLTNCTSVFSMSKHFEHSHTLTQRLGRFSAAASSELFQHTNWRRRESNHRPTLHPEPQAFHFSVHKREKPNTHSWL